MAIKLFVIVAFLVYAKASSSSEMVHLKAASKYTVHDEEVTYFEAYFACQQIGQELVSIETLEEWQAIVNLIRELGEDQEWGSILWTSANSLQAPNSKNFYWQSDGSLVPRDAIYWGNGEPNSDGDEQCLIIENFEGVQLAINDYDCSIPKRYICEKNATLEQISLNSTKF